MPHAPHLLASLFILLLLLGGCTPATGITPISIAGSSTPTQVVRTQTNVAVTTPIVTNTPQQTTATTAALTPGTSGVSMTQGRKIIVAASISIIADMVRNVGGDRVEVRTIVPLGAEPHTFDPTPNEVRALSEAQIVFINGVGLEEWFERIIANATGTRPVIEVSQGITPLKGDEEEPEGDPHMWQDATLGIRYAEQIRDGLSQLDPQGAATYRANADRYTAQLREVDAFIQDQIQTIPDEQRKLVTNHGTFNYYARRYGLEVLGSIFEGVSPEQEPSPQELTTLVRTIREQRVKAVFAENTLNQRLAEQIAREANVRVITNLYTDSLGQPGSDGETYIKMLRANTTTIVNALK